MSSPTNPLQALFGGGQLQPAAGPAHAAPAPPTTVTQQGVTPLVLAALFVPQFRDDIVISSSFFPVSWKPNKYYCATDQDAAGIAAILAASGIQVEIGSGFPGGVPQMPSLSASSLVPWFKVKKPDGTPVYINAGILAAIWTHGYPPMYELSSLLGAIQENLAA